jgi:arabinofuranosyltransferase
VRLRRLLQPEILLFFLALAARLLPGPRIIDDAYITFRYARNLLSGYGMVYNPGEFILGTTTPLYTLLMAGLGFLSGGSQAPFPILAWLTNAVADAITCFLLIRLAGLFQHRNVGIAAALVWAVAPWSVTFAIGGMETSFFVFLTTTTFYLHSKDRPIESALFGGLSLITRPDALLFLLPLAVERVRRSLRPSRINPQPFPIRWGEILAFIIPVLGWAIYGSYLYGNPVPQSMSAKAAAYQLPQQAGLIRLLQHYATPFLGHLMFGNWWIAVGLVLFPVLYGLGSLKVLREKISLWPILAYPWIYLLAFAVANPLIFRWYLTPPLPVYFLGIFLGVERLSTDLKFKPLLLILSVAVTALTINGWTLEPDHGPNRPAPNMAFIKLELLYEQVGIMLQDEILPEQVLAAGDIGALGYYSNARILDTIGLVSPASLKYYPAPSSYYVINYAIPPKLILDLRPEYLVILEAYGRNGLLVNDAFIQSYSLLQKIPTDIYDSDGMLVYRRVSTP